MKKYISHGQSSNYIKVYGDPLERAKTAFEHVFNTVELGQSPMSRIVFYGDVWCEVIRNNHNLPKIVTVRGWYASTLTCFKDRGVSPDFVVEVHGLEINDESLTRSWNWTLWVNNKSLIQHTKLNSAVVGAKMRS